MIYISKQMALELSLYLCLETKTDFIDQAVLVVTQLINPAR